MTDRETADRLIAKGYRRTSNKYCMLSRIDRADWVHEMAQQLRRAPADFYVLGEQHVDGGWCDYYRRCLSKDTITVTPEVSKLVPTSSGDNVGYVELNVPTGALIPDLTRASVLRYLEMVGDWQPVRARDIAFYLGMSVPRVSAHLVKLKKEGLVIKKTVGTGRFMRMYPGAFEFEIKQTEWKLRRPVRPIPITDDMRVMLEDLQGAY